MKQGEKELYIFLMEQSEYRVSRVIKATDAEIAGRVSVKSRTLCNARKKLQEYGLLTCARGDGNKYMYTICNPVTGQPYPGDLKIPVRIPKNPRGSPKPADQESVYETNQQPTAVSRIQLPKTDQPLESYGLPGMFGGRNSKPC